MSLWARPGAMGTMGSITPAAGPGTSEVCPHWSRWEVRRDMNFPSSSSFTGQVLSSVPLVTERTPPAHRSVLPLQCSDKTRAAALVVVSSVWEYS